MYANHNDKLPRFHVYENDLSLLVAKHLHTHACTQKSYRSFRIKRVRVYTYKAKETVNIPKRRRSSSKVF